MNATLNIGQKIDGYSVEKFVKTSADGSTESYLVSDNEGKRGLMKLYAFKTSQHSIEFKAKNVFANSSSLISMTISH